MSVVIKIVGLGSWDERDQTPFDGQYLAEYDPTRPGVDADGKEMFAHVVTVPDKRQALMFPSIAEALELWRTEHGVRQDGEPNRPLTAFTVTFEDA